ncbi:MAG: SpoIID/LytB domain-containing protein [Actinomycetota bacterium]
MNDIAPTTSPPMVSRTPRSPAMSLLAAVLAALLIVGLTMAAPRPAAAQDGSRTLVVRGHGWGHGRGLGQYGAYGYAEAGWSSARILDHYYGGTTAGPVPATASVDPNSVRVDLRSHHGRSTTVGLASGTIVLRSPAGAELARIGDGAARLVAGSGVFEVQRAPSCDGPWITMGIVNGGEVRIVAESSASGADGLLSACGPSHRVWYEGELVATTHNGSARTVNVVTIEQYLRGVVPNEMPALWPSAALEAQAVAARSYAMAGDTRQQPYADTCDTILCQVYDGAYLDRGGSFRSAHHARTDAAIAATSGVVRRTASGAVARTEFSSSTGGYTAGGAFPAVVDAGDAVAANPNHDWTVTIAHSTIEARYGLGTLRSAEVVKRNGLGADGGRALSVRFDFDRGTVFETGDRVRRNFGLKSNWFSFGPGSGAELLSTAEGAYINNAYLVLGGRPATNAELVAWQGAIENRQYRALTSPLATDGHFAGLLLDDLYRSAFDRRADSGGRAFWRTQIDDGLTIEHVGVLFYGSDEYYRRAGGTDADFITSLYRRLLDRTPDGPGLAYWEDQLARQRVSTFDIAAGFHASPEARQRRARSVYRRVLGTEGDDTVIRVLADQLRAVDERVLAAEIAASPRAFVEWGSAD